MIEDPIDLGHIDCELCDAARKNRKDDQISDLQRQLEEAQELRIFQIADFEKQLTEAQGEIGRLTEGLRKLEWCIRDYEDHQFCPACDRFKYPNNTGHKPDCWLSVLLEGK